MSFPQEFHFSRDVVEARSKLISRGLSYAVIISAIMKSDLFSLNTSTACSFFVFAVSFWTGIEVKKKRSGWAMFIHVVVILSFFYLLIFSLVTITGWNAPTGILISFIAITSVFVVLLVVDFIFLSIDFEPNESNDLGCAGLNMEGLDAEKQKKLFGENLNRGGTHG